MIEVLLGIAILCGNQASFAPGTRVARCCFACAYVRRDASRGMARRKGMKAGDADDQPTDPQAAAAERLPEQGAGAASEPAEARRVHARLYDDAEETELGAAQGRQGAAHQRVRGDRLYPG